MSFNPETPLAGAPDPWAPSTMPAWREGPPYAMTEMIAAEPALAERLVRRLADDPVVRDVAAKVRSTAEAGGPITLTGCGTSEHAAMVGAALLDDALRSAGVADAEWVSADSGSWCESANMAGLLPTSVELSNREFVTAFRPFIRGTAARNFKRVAGR